MTKSKLEYIWLDGYTPTQNMRSKTKIIEDFSGKVEDCPIWSFLEAQQSKLKEIPQIGRASCRERV